MAGADDLRPLDAAIAEIRILHEAAEGAAERIRAESDYFTHRGASPLVTDVAEALVERTEAIRRDCERLASLLQRARSAVAASAGGVARRPRGGVAPAVADVADVGGGPAGPVPPMTRGLDHTGPSYPFEPPPAEPPAEAASWRFWRRRRRRDGESERPHQAPPRLPRPDYAAMGVGPVQLPHPGSPARPPVPEAVRLIATQMAVAGASRTEIERRLQRQFGISDAAPALDEIFGSGHQMPVE